MNELAGKIQDSLITILSLSASGSLLGMLLLAGKPLLKNRVSKAFTYYIWLLGLLRLVAPIAAPVNIMGSLFSLKQQWPNSAAAEQNGVTIGDVTVSKNEQPPTVASNTQIVPPERQNNETAHAQADSDTEKSLSIWNFIKNNLFGIWLAGFLISLGWFIAVYICFSWRIRRSCVTPYRDDLAVFERICAKKGVRMACSSYIAIPMLIGVMCPVIVLPQLAYVQNGMSRELANHPAPRTNPLQAKRRYIQRARRRGGINPIVNGLDYSASEVLRYQGGAVYGYVMWYRSFNLLKADGTFSFSSSAMNSGVGTLRFGEGTYSTFKVAYREANYDIDGNPIISYIVNNEIATQEEFDAVFNEQDEKPDAIWYDFTDDNIETVFPDA